MNARGFGWLSVMVLAAAVGCGDDTTSSGGASAGGGDEGGAAAGGAATGGAGAGGGLTSADIAAYCTAIDACWDDAMPCTDSIGAGVAATPCTETGATAFACVEAHGTYTMAECNAMPVPCQTEIMAFYSCLGFK